MQCTLAAGLAAVVAVAAAAHGQSLAARIAAAGDGRVQMRYAARPGVCGDGRGSIGTGPRSLIRQDDGDDDWSHWCAPGPVRVILWMSGGTVDRLRVAVGGADSGSDVHDLGTVSTGAATDYLLVLARRAPGRVGGAAVFASVLADSVTVWPALLALARDSTLPDGTRRSATMWLSRGAAARLDGTPLFADTARAPESDDEAVRTAAIFALSQQPHRAGVAPLIDVVRANPDPRLRRQALFWLGQTGDARAIALFADILR